MARQLNKLNAKTVQNADQRGRLSDGGGLYLSVKNKETKAWLFMWTPKGSGKRREMGIGAYPNLSLAEARNKAVALRASIEQDRDPIAERDAVRKQAVLDREGQRTFAECVEEYIAVTKSEWSNDKHAYQWAQTLGPQYCQPILNKAIAAISLEDVLAVLKPVWNDKPETASRLRARIEHVISYATVKGWRTGVNPALWRGNLDQILPRRNKREALKHHPAMDYGEVPHFLGELRARKESSAKALELVILTACRTGEVLGAQWSEIDFEAGQWTIPANRMKTRKEHIVPLCDAAMDVLKPLYEVRVSDFVFPGQQGNKPLSNMAMLMLLKRMGRGDVTVHGFRSSFRDWAGNETEFPREVAETCLAHEVGNSVERAYRRSQAVDKQRRLLEAWESYVGGDPVRGNVVRLNAG